MSLSKIIGQKYPISYSGENSLVHTALRQISPVGCEFSGITPTGDFYPSVVLTRLGGPKAGLWWAPARVNSRIYQKLPLKYVLTLIQPVY